MVRNILMAFGVLLCFNLFAQQKAVKPDPRLSECFTQEYIQQLKNQPKLLAYYNYFLDHSYFIANADPAKPVESTDIREVLTQDNGLGNGGKAFDLDAEKINFKTFNPLKYAFVTNSERTVFYRLGNSGKLIGFYPVMVFDRMYKNYLKTLNLE